MTKSADAELRQRAEIDESTREAELEAELEGGEGERQSADAELRQRAETEN